MRRIGLVALLVGVLVGCEHEVELGAEPDASQDPCALPCGDDCCGPEQTCGPDLRCAPVCVRQCQGRACGDDGCGGSCGDCPEGSICDEEHGTCLPCVEESDQAICGRLELECGEAEVADLCGRVRSVACGDCPLPLDCNRETNRCEGCIPESDEDFCERLGVECGPASALDNCQSERSVSECGPCAGELEDCEGGTCVLCTPETDEEWCQAQGAECGTPEGIDRCETPRTFDCGGCEPPLECDAEHRCGDPHIPLNDDCSRPEEIAFDAEGTATLAVDTTYADETTNASCNTYSGRDVVYRFELTEPRDFRATATPLPDHDVRPTLYLRAADCAGAEVGCVRETGVGPATLEVGYLVPGAYYLWVDGLTPTLGNGPQSLAVSLLDPGPAPPNDLCASAEPLQVAGDGSITKVDGTTRGAADDHAGACASLDGGDVYYSLKLDADAALEVTVTARAGGPAWQPAVSVLSSCTASAPLACATLSGGRARVMLPSLMADTYWVVVDGTGRSRGEFTLAVRARVPPLANETCASPEAIPIDLESGLGEVAGDTTFAAADLATSCNPGASSGPDVVYTFTVPHATARNATVEVVPAAGSGYKPALTVLAQCGEPASELGCVRSTQVAAAKLRLRRLAPGATFAVVVGGGYGTFGPFTLKIELTEVPPPPENDVCARAVAMEFDALGQAVATGSTWDALDDYAGTCASASQPHDGGDVVYSFTLDEEASVEAALRHDGPQELPYRLALYLRTSCEQTASELGCAVEERLGVALLRRARLSPGTYYLVVDGVAQTGGAYRLELRTYEALTNDGCATARALPFDETGRAFARSDLCAATPSGYSEACFGSGADAVFTVTLERRQHLDVEVTFDPLGRSILYLRRDCEDVHSEIRCAKGSGGYNTLKLRDLPAGTYYLWVDSEGTTCGLFDLVLTAFDPPPAPRGDECGDMETIAIDPATGTGLVSGSTDFATAGTSSSCRWYGGNDLSGPDLNYRLVLEEPRSVELSLSVPAASAFRPVVALRTACGKEGEELGCAFQSGAANPARVHIPRLGAGTYTVVVDTYTPETSGTFELRVQLGEVAGDPPTNDRCLGATRLTFDGSGKASVEGDTSQATDDYRSFCSMANTLLTGPDLVYFFELSEPAAITAKVTRKSPNTVYKPALSIRSGCEAPEEEVACARDSSGASTVSTGLPAGTFYLFVDGVGSSTAGSDYGPFTLEVTRTTKPSVEGESCAAPEPLVFDAETGEERRSGTLAGLAADQTPSCGGSGPDRVFRFSLETAKTLELRLAPAGGTPALIPVIHLRRACADLGSERTCAAKNVSAELTHTVQRLEPGTWFLWVNSGSSSSAGAYELTARIRDPSQPAPENDACAHPAVLALDPVSRAARVTAETTFAHDDFLGTCGHYQWPQGGGDLVYAVELDEPATLHALVRRDASQVGNTLSPALYLRRACAPGRGAADELACVSAMGYPGASLAKALPAGVYYLIVDSERDSGGAFVLDVVATVRTLGENEDCATAEPIELDADGRAVVAGDTTGRRNDLEAPCGDSTTAPDLVYQVTLDARRDLTVEISPGQTFRPAVHVRSSCAEAATQRICVHEPSQGVPLRFTLPRLDRGTWFIWVDGYLGFAGFFLLRLEASEPPPPPPGDTCRSVTDLVFDSSGKAEVVGGSTADAYDDWAGSCGAAALTGPDVVYRFVLDSEAAVTAKVTRGTASPAYLPAVSLRTACEGGGLAAEAACGAAPSSGVQQGVAIATATLPAGEAWVVVDGVNGSYGEFNLELSRGPARPGDNCQVPQMLGLPFGTVAPIGANTADFAGHTAGSCAPESGPDLVWALDVLQEGTLDIALAPSAGSPLKAAVFLRRSCAGPDPAGPPPGVEDELFCALGAASGPWAIYARVPRLAAGIYYLWVDTASASPSLAGAFEGTVSLSPLPAAPANDRCEQAAGLAFTPSPGGEGGADSEVATASGETWFANDDLTGTCDLASGPDLVYAFQTDKPRKLVAQVSRDPTSPGYLPTVYLRSDCGALGDLGELTCARAISGVATATVTTLPAGTWYLFVDGTRELAAGASGDDATPGKFSLEVVLAAPEEGRPNESCARAEALHLGGKPGSSAMALGSTVGAQGEAWGSCSPHTASSPDVVYAFTLGAPSRVTVTVASLSASFRPAVYLRSACGDPAAQQACAAATSSASSVTVTAPSLRVGSYWIWVDGASSNPADAAGDFALEIALADPAGLPPDNDTCEGAIALSWGVAEIGDTSMAMNDYRWGTSSAPGCYPPPKAEDGLYAPDLVYRFTPLLDGPFKVVVNATPVPWDAAVWVGTGTCGDAAACVAGQDSKNPETVTIEEGRAGTTYWIYVDGAGTAAGRFTVTVSAP